jgi:site-specific recombinase XerC
MQASIHIQKKGQVNGNARVVREFVAYLRVEKGLRPASCEAYRRDLEQFAEHVEGRDGLLVGATQGDVSGFMERLRGHAVESRSIARKLSCLRGFYRWLLMDKRIDHDPTVNVETPSSWKVLPKSLAEGEVAEMLESAGAAARAADADSLALRDHAILELLDAGGLERLLGFGWRICISIREGRRLGGREIRNGLFRWGGWLWRLWRDIWLWGGRGWCGAGCSGRYFSACGGMR